MTPTKSVADDDEWWCSVEKLISPIFIHQDITSFFLSNTFPYRQATDWPMYQLLLYVLLEVRGWCKYIRVHVIRVSITQNSINHIKMSCCIAILNEEIGNTRKMNRICGKDNNSINESTNFEWWKIHCANMFVFVLWFILSAARVLIYDTPLFTGNAIVVDANHMMQIKRALIFWGNAEFLTKCK